LSQQVTLDLPLPHKSLSPNARVHWAAKSKMTRRYRGFAKLAAMQQLLPCHPWKSATVRCVFTFPCKRSRDRDNMLSSMKAVFDGIADAGIVLNDSGFTHLPIEVTEPNKMKPGVMVIITES